MKTKIFLFILIAIFSTSLIPFKTKAQEPQATLQVSLPMGTVAGPDPDAWLDEGWLLNITKTSWTFNVTIVQTSKTNPSYDTHLVVALNDAAYNNLLSLTINDTTISKTHLKKGTPTPYDIILWPDDVYPTWFNDTLVNLKTIYHEEYMSQEVEVMVSAKFSNITDARMHFDAYGKTIPCTTQPETPDEITYSPNSADSTVIGTPTNPVANFTYTPTTPITNETIIIDGSPSYDPDGWITNYTWNFGDSNTTTTTNPVITHTYAEIGNYTTTLAVTDNDGNTAFTSDIIHVIQPPRAHFTHLPITPVVGQSVTFNASTSTPNGGIIVNYTWNFGDNNTTTTTNPVITHTYATRGPYNVTLTITDDEGLSDATCKTLLVREPPKAAFVYTPMAPLVDETITFNASNSQPNGGFIIWYYWNFGDNAFANQTVPVTTHIYNETGNYNVTLTVGDTEDLTDTTSAILEIETPTQLPRSPRADFITIPQTAYATQIVTFDATTSEEGFDGINYCPITWYHWDFGDGKTANLTAPSTDHVYTSQGNYNVTLTIYAPRRPDGHPEYYPYDITWNSLKVVSMPVGGYAVSSNKLRLVIPWIGVLLGILLATVLIRKTRITPRIQKQ